MDNVAIKVENVSKSFKLPHEKSSSIKSSIINFRRRGYTIQNALKEVSFEIQKGEFFGIVGRNGSGKTTLLKILAGIYQTNGGQVTVNGKLVPFIELGVGFNPELTGRENVYLNGALMGFSEKEVSRMYKDIVEFAELEKFMDQKLKNYSSGMQVRLAFSMAIRSNADILLLDEVLAVGDLAFQRKCYEYFHELKRLKKTVVFVSHDLTAVEEYCDRVAMIDNSRLTFIGNPTETTMLYRSAMAMQDKPGDYKPEHLGTGEVQITKLQVLQNNKVVKQISEGEPFDIKIKYQANKEISNPVFGLAVVNMNDTIVAGPHTQEAAMNLGTIKGEGHIVASFKSNPLSSGIYTFMASCFNEDLSAPYDFINNASQLEILGKKRYGVVSLSPVWTTKQYRMGMKKKVNTESLKKRKNDGS